MKKSNFMLALVLVIVVVAAASVSFAVWDSLSDTDDSIGSSIGNNVYVSITESTPFIQQHCTLVPKGALCGPNDVTEYSGATFKVVHGDASDKSSLRIKLTVTTDGRLDVSNFFTLTLVTTTADASANFDEGSNTTGSIVVPMTNIGGKTEGMATFVLGMSFRDNATDISGFNDIVGRQFKIKIDISAE